MGLLDDLLEAWAKTDNQRSEDFTFSVASIKTVSEGSAVTASNAEQLDNLKIVSGKANELMQHCREKLAVLDAFTGEKSSTLYYTTEAELEGIANTIDDSYANFAKGVYQGLLFQTRLKPYMDKISIKLEGEELVLDYSSVIAQFNEVHAQNAEKAVVDLAEFLTVNSGQNNWQEGKDLFLLFAIEANKKGLLSSWVRKLDEEILEALPLIRQDGSESNDHLVGFDALETGEDLLYGFAGNDSLEGKEGDDKLYGGDGNDHLVGGVDNDLLDGGRGDDTYVFGKNFGHDVINSLDKTEGKKDKIQFSDGILEEHTTYTRKNSDLHILVTDQGEIAVKYFFVKDATAGHQIEIIEFADGQSIALNALKEKMLHSTDGDDELTGYHTDDVISGGKGADVIHGAQGNDTYLFSEHFGQDSVINFNQTNGYTDEIVFAPKNGAQNSDYGLSSQDFRLKRKGNDLIIQYLNSDDRVTVERYLEKEGYSQYQLANIRFSDGVIYDLEVVKKLVLQGTEGRDHLYGSSIDDHIKGLGGNDTIEGESGADKLDGGEGDDYLYGGTGNDKLYGGEGADNLNGNVGEDILHGGSGNDSLRGGSGNDSLFGDQGNDYLSVDDGNDRYVFGKDFGQDTINNYDTAKDRLDVIEFTDGWK